MPNDNMIKLEHFFMVDKRIKDEMIAISPPIDYLDTESLIKYTDKLDDSLNYIFMELRCVVKDLFMSNGNTVFYEKVLFLEKLVKKKFMECSIDIVKLKKFYQIFISNMSPMFIDTVKLECVGYSIDGCTNSLSLVSSINELLHLLHSEIMNNDRFFRELPLIESKVNDYKYPLRLRGNRNSFFENVFALFPMNLDCGYTDMIIVNDNKLIMMVRDRGHALSIEVTIRNNVARVEYFVPKLCNLDMINRLPGVNKVSTYSRIGATGCFEVNKDMLALQLYNFISMVPTDDDIKIVGFSR